MLIFLAFGATSLQAAQLTKIKLCETVRSVFYVPMYVAISQGFFEKEGLDVELSTAWGSDKAAAALVSGSVDISLLGPEASIYVYNQGAPNHFVLFAEVTACDGSFLVARKPDPDFKWTDVKGKTIVGARPGGIPELCLEAAVKKAGLEPFKDVEILRNIAYTATTGAFAAGTGDFVALFEPTPSLLETQGIGYVVASIGKQAGPTAYTAFHAREDYLKAHPETIQKATNALYRGMLWSQRHTPDELVKAIGKFFTDIEPAVLHKSVDRYQKIGAWQTTPVLSREAFNRLQDIMAMGEELTKRVPFAEIVDNSFAEKAVAAIKL
jgi:NitT/TauT family transport system substrate-binding protein